MGGANESILAGIALAFAAALLLPATASALDPPEPQSVLFVSNGYYQQETIIRNHLLSSGAYTVTVKKDYQVTGTLNLAPYDLVILTEFAPNVSTSGINNIKNSGKPVLIVEYWDFNYSKKLGLTTSASCGYVGTRTVEVMTHEHPVTYFLGDDIDVYTTSYTVYGIDIDDVKPGVAPLVWSSASFEEVAVLVDDARRYAATGIYDTRKYTTDAWMLFDRLLAHLTRPEVPDLTSREVYDRLAWSGVAELLGELSEEREQWTPAEARAEVWPMLVRAELTDLSEEVFALVDLVLVSNWAIVPSPMRPGAPPQLGSLLFVPGGLVPPTQVELIECATWKNQLRDEWYRRLPTSVSYRAEAAGIPRLRFAVPFPWVDTVFAGQAAEFAIALSTTEVKQIGSSQLGPLWVARISTGATELLSRKDLFPVTAGGAWDTYRDLYWWGRRAEHSLLPAVTAERTWMKEPFSLVVRETEGDPARKMSVLLDFFKFEGGAVKSKRTPKCSVRFFAHPYADGDGWHDDADWPDFATDPMPTPIPFPTQEVGGVANECFVESAYNPFVSQDGQRWPWHPNTFGDAVSGDNEGLPVGIELNSLLPRVQLMWPSNHFLSRRHPIEAYCEANPGTCQGVADGDQDALDAFNAHFGLDPGDEVYSEYGRHLLTPRHRTGVPWAGPGGDGMGDRGPWQKPRIKAGLGMRVAFLLRSEHENMPPETDGADLYDRAVCQAGALGQAMLFYRSRETGEYDEDNPLVFDLECFPTATDNTLLASHGVSVGEGLTYASQQLLEVPSEAAFGEAALFFEAEAVLHGTGGPESVTVSRLFPVFIDPLEAFTDENGSHDRFALVPEETQPAAWIGTGWMLSEQPYQFGSYRKSALHEFMGVDCDLDNPVCRSLFWLLGSDEGPWFERTSNGETVLFSLFGDINVAWDDPFGVLDFGWFEFRGTGLAFEHVDDEWIQDTDNGVYLPALAPVMTENGLPWEMVRAPGASFENGIFQDAGCDTPGAIGCVRDCHETGAETVAPMSAFQFASQHESGESQVWFSVASDWGNVGLQGYGDEGPRVDPLLKLNIGPFHYGYDREYEPYWWSFLGRWHPESGVDDLGRASSWKWMNGYQDASTTFVLSSAVAVEDLGTLLYEDFDAGILVWHTGRYRASPVYLSYAAEEDVLHPDRYMHFAGMQGGVPTWTENEAAAVPVIWDDVGELTAVDLGPGENGTIFDRFVVLYQVNSSGSVLLETTVLPLVGEVVTDMVNATGQEGIILRQSDNPWGPYSQPVVLLDCTSIRTDLLGIVDVGGMKINQALRHVSDGFSSCYGGFTHESLWGWKEPDPDPEPEENWTKLRFNVSMWRPYKALLVESMVKEK
jgi:hypothetical protein